MKRPRQDGVKASRIREKADRATAAIYAERAIEKNPQRRRILEITARVKQHRAIGGGFIESLGEWFVMKSTPDELRQIAKELEEIPDEIMRSQRLNYAQAYQAALAENDPRHRWLGWPGRNAPGPIGSQIKFPPTLAQVRSHFVKLFGEANWPQDQWRARKTLTQTLKLPLGKGKPTGRPRKSRNRWGA